MLEAWIGWYWWSGVDGAGSSQWLVLEPVVAGPGSL